MAITQLTKIVNGSLVPSNEQLAGSLVELSQGEGNSLVAVGDGLMVDLTSYATSTSVDTKIAEAQLSGGEVDLSAYATNDSVDSKIAAIPATDISEKVDKLEGKGLSTEDFTTVHKTAVEGIDATVSAAVNTAIASVVNGAPAAFDTLKEISDWIEGDGVNAAELTAAITGKADQTSVDTLETRLEVLETSGGSGLSMEEVDAAIETYVMETYNPELGSNITIMLEEKLNTPDEVILEGLETTVVNSVPLYTLNNSGTYVLCTPDIWLKFGDLAVPAYYTDTIGMVSLPLSSGVYIYNRDGNLNLAYSAYTLRIDGVLYNADGLELEQGQVYGDKVGYSLDSSGSISFFNVSGENVDVKLTATSDMYPYITEGFVTTLEENHTILQSGENGQVFEFTLSPAE